MQARVYGYVAAKPWSSVEDTDKAMNHKKTKKEREASEERQGRVEALARLMDPDADKNEEMIESRLAMAEALVKAFGPRVERGESLPAGITKEYFESAKFIMSSPNPREAARAKIREDSAGIRAFMKSRDALN